MTLHQADLSKSDQLTNLINNVKKLSSQWIGLINNAGLFKYDDGINFDFENLNDHMSVNFTAPAILTQALARFTIEKQKKDKNFKLKVGSTE